MPHTTAPPDLLIVGGGPAGCAAALMAASLGMRTTLIEPRGLCHRLHHIPVIANVLGFASGSAYAEAIIADITRTRLVTVLRDEVLSLNAADADVTVTLSSGERLTAPHAIAATGVRPLRAHEAAWIDGPDDLEPALLWEAKAEDLHHAEPLVLGADRPLGTLLRTHPELPMKLVVLHPATDRYKADEVRDDHRVALIVPDGTVRIARNANGALTVRATVAGSPQQWDARLLYTNLGNTAAVPTGALLTDSTGYCPPDQQHPRIFTAGDLRSPRGQRIAIATGSGADAALNAYYATHFSS